MRPTRRCIASTVLLFCLLCGCTAESLMGGISRGDWEYQGLPNNYSVIRVNGEDIRLSKDDRTVIGAYVSYIAWTNDAILIQQGSVQNHVLVLDDPNYYIVLFTDSSVLGPLSKTEFDSQRAALGLDDGTPVPWIRTTELHVPS